MEKDILKEYEKNVTLYTRLEKVASEIIDIKFGESGVKIHSSSQRIKQLSSIQNKLIRTGIGNDEKRGLFEFVKDVIGIRKVCLFIDDLQPLSEIVRNTFEVLEEDNKIENLQANTFGYFSIHFILKLASDLKGPHYDQVKDIPFELQLRTISMDAWAGISYYLAYKNENDIPEFFKRDYFALSGLFYLADTHFQMLYREKEKFKLKLTQVGKDNLWEKQKIDLESIEFYMKKKFVEREHVGQDDLSELLSEMRILKEIENLGSLNAVVDRRLDEALKEEKQNPPFYLNPKTGLPEETIFSDIGILRYALDIEYPAFKTNRMKKHGI